MNSPRDEIVQKAIARARQTLDEAGLLGEHGYWNACVNRLYYACFYAVSAVICDTDIYGQYSRPRCAPFARVSHWSS